MKNQGNPINKFQIFKYIYRILSQKKQINEQKQGKDSF